MTAYIEFVRNKPIATTVPDKEKQEKYDEITNPYYIYLKRGYNRVYEIFEPSPDSYYTYIRPYVIAFEDEEYRPFREFSKIYVNGLDVTEKLEKISVLGTSLSYGEIFDLLNYGPNPKVMTVYNDILEELNLDRKISG